MTENPPIAAGKRYRLGKFTFEHQPNGRWGVSDGMLGVGGHRTPLGAYLALRRWRRDPASCRPVEAE
jgi:hypothetical protein